MEDDISGRWEVELQSLFAEGWGGECMPLAVGTNHSWSSVGVSRGVRVDMRSYNRILGLRGDVIVVQAGCLLRDVIKALGQQGRCLASGTNSQKFFPVPILLDQTVGGSIIVLVPSSFSFHISFSFLLFLFLFPQYPFSWTRQLGVPSPPAATARRYFPAHCLTQWRASHWSIWGGPFEDWAVFRNGISHGIPL